MIRADEAAEDLRDLHNRYGSRLVADHEFAGSIVRDSLMPKFPIEAPLLAEAAARGVVDEIRHAGKRRKARVRLLQVAASLARDAGWDMEAACWVVSAWAMAIGTLSTPLVDVHPPPPSCSSLPAPVSSGVPRPPIQVPMPPPKATTRSFRGVVSLLLVGLVGATVIAGVRNKWWLTFVQRFWAQATKEQTAQEPWKIGKPEVEGQRPAAGRAQVQAQQPGEAGGIPRKTAQPVRPREVPTTPDIDLSSISITIVGDDVSVDGKSLGPLQLQSLLKQAAAVDKSCSVRLLYDERREKGQLEEIKGMCRAAGLRRIAVFSVAF